MLIRLVIFLFQVHPALGVAGLFGVVVFLVWRSRQGQSFGHSDDHSMGSHVPPPTARSWFQVDITEVRIALDARSRAFLQRELMNAGRSANTSTKRGLVDLLRITLRA
ncbi:DUF1517 domain-containing protein, partial [Luteitalea sp.]|uniref:DUF1517 domain-containing protein n=1 Tax=Luteitalea sp. TaxID=2004800 RepID=UPI0025C725B8